MVNRYSCQRILSLTRSANAMKVRFTQLGKVEVDDNIDGLYVNSSCEEIWMEGQVK